MIIAQPIWISNISYSTATDTWRRIILVVVLARVRAQCMALPLRLFALLLTASSVLFSFPLCIVILDSKLHTYLFRTAATRDARMQIGSSRECSLCIHLLVPVSACRVSVYCLWPVFQLQILLGIIQYIDFRPFPFLSRCSLFTYRTSALLTPTASNLFVSFPLPFLSFSFSFLPNKCLPFHLTQ